MRCGKYAVKVADSVVKETLATWPNRSCTRHAEAMTLAHVVLIHLVLVCPLIRLVSIMTNPKYRQRRIKVLHRGVKRSQGLWRGEHVSSDRRIGALSAVGRGSMRKGFGDYLRRLSFRAHRIQVERCDGAAQSR